MAEAAQEQQDRKRSPGFPTITLEEAIKKVKKLYDEDKNNPMTGEVMAAHLESKTSSSAFMQWIASMKRFGLLVGVGPNQVKVSPLAVDILLLPEGDPRRPAKIKEAALLPKAHQELWKVYGLNNLPSDANLRHTLVTTKGFQLNPANDFIAQYKKTLAFAKLTDGDRISEVLGDIFGVGRSVNGEKPENPAEDPKGKNMQSQQNQQTGQTLPPAGFKQDVFSAETGDVVIRWPAALTAEDLEDIEGWIDMMKRKIKRSVNPNLKSDSPANIDMDPQ